jgi:abortive infection bacteriophage resistance protein
MRFAKPALALDDQLALLERRGLVIDDRDRARHYLAHISYYRLRAYWLPFEDAPPAPGEHCFRDGMRFDDVLALYVFDRRLRLLVLDAVERVEVSFRAHWSHHLATRYGPHGYLDPAIYARPDHFQRGLDTLREEFERSRDTFAEHYRNRYGDPELPPIWMIAELISFGQLSKWFTNLAQRSDRKAIADPFGIDERILGSFGHHIVYIRNICAHHARLWNKRFTVTMQLPRTPAPLSASLNASTDRLLYNTLTTMAHLLRVIAPGSTWRARVRELIVRVPQVDPTLMGFPADWTTRPTWRPE